MVPWNLETGQIRTSEKGIIFMMKTAQKISQIIQILSAVIFNLGCKLFGCSDLPISLPFEKKYRNQKFDFYPKKFFFEFKEMKIS